MSTGLPPTEARPTPPATDAPSPTPVGPLAPPRPRRRWWPWALGGLAVLLVAAFALRSRAAPTAPAPPTATPAPPALTARGRVQPLHQARIGTLTGGVVSRLSVVAGESVGDQQEVARVRGAGGAIEVLTAPWAGTITAVPANLGDTVTPGATLVTIGDLSRLQIETTDVDEFLIGKLARGQSARVTIDALDGRELNGVVRSITLQPQPTGDGDEHYPIVIALSGPNDDLRVGMTVRFEFQQGRPLTHCSLLIARSAHD
jgi:multidrug efflux pump subunit AcrA (membrane-fusion protein)